MTQAATTQQPRTLCLIDLSGIWHANWHVTESQPLGEAYEMTIRKVRHLADGYDFTAVCLDAPPYKRKEIAPEYKAQRDKLPENMIGQFERVKERLRADGLLLLSCHGYEADDVIATMAHWACREGLFVRVASSDKDLLQLVSENVEVYSTARDHVFDVDEVITRWGPRRSSKTSARSQTFSPLPLPETSGSNRQPVSL